MCYTARWFIYFQDCMILGSHWLFLTCCSFCSGFLRYEDHSFYTVNTVLNSQVFWLTISKRPRTELWQITLPFTAQLFSHGPICILNKGTPSLPILTSESPSISVSFEGGGWGKRAYFYLICNCWVILQVLDVTVRLYFLFYCRWWYGKWTTSLDLVLCTCH